ncbi:unnamed protein product [Clonostachys chloroleuca]|uniref:Protein kinase domain-containing protein n=1 Tax=Clonostachys chloroleuca TaxID=1926264 RepID=A0AA35LZT1_9HYPO|nr:unnamed protein product [Clonostachys chloroleuca]
MENHPYYTNNILELKIKTVGKKSSRNLKDGGYIKARVVDILQPSTLSVVMVVELLEPVEQDQDRFGPGPGPQQLILKMYDRRFSPHLREEINAGGSATRETETKFVNFLDEDRMPGFFTLYQNAAGFVNNLFWSTAQKEAYLALFAADMNRSEVLAYDHLVHLQGDAVPVFHADVQLALRSAPDQSSHPLAGVEGVLLDYIPGFPMTELGDKVPEKEWPAICDQAIEKVNKIIDLPFINHDMVLRNTIVSGGEGGGQYKVYYIDFAMCDFRSEFDPDEIWRERKRRADEEGKIGFYLSSCLSVARIEKAKKRYEGRDAPDPPPPGWKFMPSNLFAGKAMKLPDA